MKQPSLQPMSSALRFRRWSRKGYAAFISLRRAVTIGQLSTSVSERFQAKNLALHTRLLSGPAETDGEEEGAKGESEERIGTGSLSQAGLYGFGRTESRLFFSFPLAQANAGVTGIAAIGACRLIPADGRTFIQNHT